MYIYMNIHVYFGLPAGRTFNLIVHFFLLLDTTQAMYMATRQLSGV